MHVLHHQKPNLQHPMQASAFHPMEEQPGSFLDLLENNEAANSSLRTKSGMQKNQPTQEPSMKSSMKTNSSTVPSKLQPIGVNGAITSEKQPNISFMSKHSTILKRISSTNKHLIEDGIQLLLGRRWNSKMEWISGRILLESNRFCKCSVRRTPREFCGQ